ncbi:hypothetical protein FHG66_01565 [Rubellimicrobium rubrum]|uniref:Rad50/SbcC-type AAA domain-containing protein n=1 Tax=Rubellimicrobium rubrum TaxID=2585369 RepID=A0A5C4N9P2_9RHOB|nr:AAA family ATPase [Rubellimicrobium rubrum]TNC53002.1 hypothetical protein FHG66_01565 [Rubellimicrobium rubrum]
MQLRRIEVRDFRKLQHVVVEDLRDGLNVVVGDNEAGKSTLLAALRTVLFERHRIGGKVAQGMMPFGQTVRPEIRLDFDLGGERWRLRKAFCQKPEAELEGSRERLTGDAVEERLAELLGFTPPGAGGSKPAEHQGAYGLLWVQQGTAHESLGVGAGRDSIASALETEVGQVLGGERGRALLSAAEKRRQDFWTKLDKPRGAWKDLRDEVEALETERAELVRRFEAHDGKVSELASRQDALARHAHEDSLGQAQRDLGAARRAMAEAERLDQGLREAETRGKLASAARDAALDRRNARLALIRRAEEAARAWNHAQVESRSVAGLLAAQAAASEKQAQRLRGLREELVSAGAQVGHLEQALRRGRAREDLRRLETQLSGAEEADRLRREALNVVRSIRITPATLREIEGLQQRLDRATAQRQAASVRIDFTPEQGRRAQVDGRAHDPATPVWLSQDSDLTLEGYGRLRVHPGGGARDLVQQSEEAERVLMERLHADGVADLAQARSELQRRLAGEQEAQAQLRLIEALAPQGLDALRQEVESQRALLAQPNADPNLSTKASSEAALDAARLTQRSASQAVEAAEAEAGQAEATRVATDRELATLEGRAAGLARDNEALARELIEVRSAAADEALDRVLGQAEAELREAQAEVARARAALDASDPEIVRLELRRAEKAEEAIRADIDRLTRGKRDLEVELSALGREGVGEALAEAEGKLELRRRQLLERGHEAEASRLLHEALTGAQRESKDRWLGPVRERVRPYLRILQPDADVVLNETTLEIEGFRRGDREEAFHDLSIGAREQVAVITRLALADILRGSNRPSAVILDDALVNTDEGRLARMHLVLHKAAENLQVLVLTCRERDFRQLGAPVTRIR